MSHRQLNHANFTEVLAELDHLHGAGYRKVGAWDLAQVADHLAYFIDGSVNGFTFKVPWLVRVLFGRLVLQRILKSRRMRMGVPTPQKPLPAVGGDESAAVDRLKRAIERFQAHQGEYHDSPFFGHLTRDEWRELHVIHCAHHLGYLVPAREA